MKSPGTAPRLTPLLIPVVLILAASCVGDTGGAGDDGPGAEGPNLVALDSIRLLEGEDAIIEEPSGLVVDPIDGSFFVPDFGGGRVLRFDRAGELLLQYGRRPGEGPGELERARAAFLLDSATVAVFDIADRRMSTFARSTADFRTSHEIPAGGSLGSTPPIVSPPWIWFPTVPPDWTTGRADVEGVLRWRPGEEAEFVGAMPSEFSRLISQGRWTYPNFLTEGSLAIRDGLLYRGWQAKNELWVMTPDGEIRDTLRLPVVRRRGVGDDVPERFDSAEMDADERREAISWLRQLHVLPDRRIVGQDMETWVRMFRVDTDACDWTPLD